MTPPGLGSTGNRLLLPRGRPLPTPHQDPFQMVRLPERGWGWAENLPEARTPSPGLSAKLPGGPAASRPGTRSGSHTGETSGVKKSRAGAPGGRGGGQGSRGDPAAGAWGACRPVGSWFISWRRALRGSCHLDARPRSAAWA